LIQARIYLFANKDDIRHISLIGFDRLKSENENLGTLVASHFEILEFLAIKI
jgi:hypothetical protein